MQPGVSQVPETILRRKFYVIDILILDKLSTYKMIKNILAENGHVIYIFKKHILGVSSDSNGR